MDAIAVLKRAVELGITLSVAGGPHTVLAEGGRPVRFRGGAASLQA